MIFPAAANLEDILWPLLTAWNEKNQQMLSLLCFKCNMYHNDNVLSEESVPVSAGSFSPTAKGLYSQQTRRRRGRKWIKSGVLYTIRRLGTEIPMPALMVNIQPQTCFIVNCSHTTTQNATAHLQLTLYYELNHTHTNTHTLSAAPQTA